MKMSALDCTTAFHHGLPLSTQSVRLLTTDNY